MIAAVMANVAKVSTEHATALCLPSEPYLGQGTTGAGCQAAGPDVIVPSLFPLVHWSLESSCLYVASFNSPAYFWLPTGAQEMLISVRSSVCPFGPSLSRAVNLHHSGSNLRAISQE